MSILNHNKSYFGYFKENSLFNPKIKLKDFFSKSHASKMGIYSLTISNIVIFGFAIYSRWELEEFLFVFVIQTIIIGFFSLLKIILFKNVIFPNTRGVSLKTQKIAYSLIFAFFFLAFSLPALGIINYLSWALSSSIIIPIIVLVVNHFISFISNFKLDSFSSIKYDQLFYSTMIRCFVAYIPVIYFFSVVIIFTLFTILFEITGYQFGVDLDILNLTLLSIMMIIKTNIEIRAHIFSHTDLSKNDKISF